MQYLPLFLLFMAVLIAGYFYLARAKKRDAGPAGTEATPPTESEAPSSTPE
jgi:hypothetical protein